MGRSSRFLSFVCLFAATPVLAQGFHARGVPMVGPGVYRPVVVPRIVVPSGARRTLPVTRPRLPLPSAGGYANRGRRGFRYGFGGPGVGLGLSLAGDLAVPPSSYGYDSPAPGPIPAYVAQPRCIHPLIIEVGRGMRLNTRPKTRVVYGQAPACVP